MQPCICPFLHVYRFIKYGLLQIGNDFFCICAHRVEVLFGGHKANPQAIANKLEFEVFHRDYEPLPRMYGTQLPGELSQEGSARQGERAGMD